MTMIDRLSVALALLSACHHAGNGEGVIESPVTFRDPRGDTEEVRFAWSSGADTSAGKIEASLPDGAEFAGTFIQVKQTLRVDSARPYYDVWTAQNWGAGAPWYSGSEVDFVTVFGGTTLAHMRSDDGRRMRCKFVLRDPVRGFGGGAYGQCQLSDGELIYDAVLAERVN
jgi:hypothetical protein